MTPSFAGRDAELAELCDRVRAAMSRRGGAIVVVGDVGVGKTALLEEVLRRVATRATVLRATGVEDETELGWAGLASLARPLVRTAGDTSAARRRALDTVLHGEAEAQEPVEAHAVSLAFLDLLAAASSHGPVVVAVDDLHWLDAPSRAALLYVARRIADEAVAVIATSRHSPEVDLFPRFELGPPSDADSDRILSSHGVVDRATRAGLIDALGTNPLMLLNAVGKLDPEVRRGRAPLPDPLRFSTSVLDGALRRIEKLEPAARSALEVIAVLGRPTQSQAHHALRAVGLDLVDLEDAERAGVIEIAETIRFDHPTIRTAALEQLTAPDRRRLHRIAASVPDQSRVARAIHRAMSTVGVDEDAAVDLVDAAEELVRMGAAPAAAEQFVRAAQLTPDVGRATACRRRAVELFLDLGSLARARELLDGIPPDADATRLRARVLHLDGQDEEAITLVLEATTASAETDPQAAARLLLESLAPLVREVRLEAILDVIGRLRALRNGLDGNIGRRVDAVSAVFDMIGAPPAADGLAPFEELIRAEGVVAAAPFIAEVIAPALAFARRDEALGTLLDGVERALRDRAAIVPLISVLAAQQLRHFGRNQILAIEAGEEAVRLAAEIGRPKLAMVAASALAIGAATTGQDATFELASDLLESSDHPASKVARLVALGTLHMMTGRYADALRYWEELAATRDFGDPFLTFEAEYVETLAKLNRTEEARALLERLDAAGFTQRSRGMFDRGRGILAEDDSSAAEHFARSIAQFKASDNRLGEGRTELCWGERLRRSRRRGEARPHLERARALFRELGVATLARQAEGELTAAGVAVDTDLPVHAMLTTQELRVARLVAAGEANREIATQMFISARTVESHITTIFRKLHVKNRRQLAALAVVDPALRQRRA